MSAKIAAHNVAMAGGVMKAWLELREEWGWANISDAEFIERAEQIGMGRCARELVAQIAERLAKPAVAQNQAFTAPKPEQWQEDSQSTQLTEKTLLNRLTSAGLTDIEMISTFVVRAKDADGNPVFLMLYPDSNLEWQIAPLDGADDSSTSSPD